MNINKQIIFVALFLFKLASPVWVLAVDLDGNGYEDAIEEELIERFCPSFVIHTGNVMSPEPVEIMLQPGSGNYVGLNDLFLEEWYSDFSFAGDRPYCETYQADCATQLLYRFGTREAWYWNEYGAEVYFYLHLEYGEMGNEDAVTWRNAYLNGGPTVPGPGSAFPTTTYAHVFDGGPGKTVIQYWFFYPYNDWVANHEGDWEHINVVLTETIHGYRLLEVDYNFHHFRVTIPHSMLDNIYLDHFTHPVVFVGGRGGLLCGGAYGSGDASGGSYPMFGQWDDVGATVSLFNILLCPHVDETITPGRYINYRDVNVVRMPKMLQDINEDPYSVTFFSEHPEHSWMHLNAFWGHRLVDLPGGWDEIPGASGEANAAPITPLYHPAWESRTGTSSLYTYSSLNENIFSSPDILFLSAYEPEGPISGLEFAINELDGEVVSTISAPGYLMIYESWPRKVVKAPFVHTDGAGNKFCFVRWETSVYVNGALNNPSLVVSDDHSDGAEAEYVMAELDLGVVNAVYDIPVSGGEVQSILAFPCDAPTGGGIEGILIDARAVSNDAGILGANDSGGNSDEFPGDDIWTAGVNFSNVQIGAYHLPFIARGQDENTLYCGVINVEVKAAETDFNIIESTVVGVFEAGPENESAFRFSWVADHYAKPEVLFYRNDEINDLGCTCIAPVAGGFLLNYMTPGVVVEVVEQPGGLFNYEVYWEELCCSPSCKFSFCARNLIDGIVAESDNFICKTGRYCLGGS